MGIGNYASVEASLPTGSFGGKVTPEIGSFATGQATLEDVRVGSFGDVDCNC